MDQLKKNLIYKIARDYYQEGHTQQEIADKYGISRIMVSRMLAKAIKEKIVEIRLNIPDDPNFETERLLEEKYGLKEAIVVSSISDSYNDMLEFLGEAARDFLIRNIQGNDTISVSWGLSLLSMVNSMPQSNFPGITVTQMIGGMGFPEEMRSGTDLVRRLANSFNAQARILSSPGIVKDKSLCDALKEEPQVKLTLRLARDANLALVGIGHFSEDSILRKSDVFFSKEDIDFLEEHQAVGDISLRFFNKEGKLIKGKVDDRVVGLTADEIIKIPKVAGIAGGIQKLPTIKAALKTGMIDVLITDDKTAEGLSNL